MKSSHLFCFLLLVLFLATVIPASVAAQTDFPRLMTVTPDTGKVGDELTVEGKNLGKKHVKELYLTDGQHDWKTAIVEQTDTAIKFKIPSDAKAGRFNMMVLTVGAEPSLLEQPVKVTVEGGKS